MSYQSATDDVLLSMPLYGAVEKSGLYYAELVDPDNAPFFIGKNACGVRRASDSVPVYSLAASPIANIGICKTVLRRRMANKVREIGDLLCYRTTGIPNTASIRVRRVPDSVILGSGYSIAEWEHCLITAFVLITGSFPLMNGIRSEALDGTSTMRVRSFTGTSGGFKGPPITLMCDPKSRNLFWGVVDELFFRSSGDLETNRRIKAAQLLIDEFARLCQQRRSIFRKVYKRPSFLLLHADVSTAPGLNCDSVSLSVSGNFDSIYDHSGFFSLLDGVISVIPGLELTVGKTSIGVEDDLRVRLTLERGVGNWMPQW